MRRPAAPHRRGELTATLAVTERRGEWRADDTTVSMTRTDGQVLLTGGKNYVPDGDSADVVLVLARGEQGLSLCWVDAPARRMVRTSLPTMDLTRKQSSIEFADTPATLVGEEGQAWPVVERISRKRPSRWVASRLVALSAAWKWPSSTPKCGSPSVA